MTESELTMKILRGPAGGIAGTIGRPAAMDVASAIIAENPIRTVPRGGTGKIYESDLVTALSKWKDLARQNGVPVVERYGETIDELLISLAQQWVNLTRRGVEL